MKINSLPYLIIQGFKNLWVNRLMSLASISVLLACLLLVGFAILFTANVNNVVVYVENQNEAVVFVKDNAVQIEIEALANRLKDHSNISEVSYISKEQALEIESERLGQDAILLEGLEKDNPLPASFNIKVADLNLLKSTIEDVTSMPSVEQVNAATEVSDTILIIKDLVNSVGGAIILALVIVSLVIISNTIRASVFFRRREINIMKYVGATNGFIKFPFFIEGIILGILSSGFAFLITWSGYTALTKFANSGTSTFLESIFENMVNFDVAFSPIVFSYLIAGLVIGTMGSLFSIRSHLKV